MGTEEIIEIWRAVILGEHKSWVMFGNGTCVILMEPEEDLAAQATGILREYGPVHAGTSSADFGIIELDDAPGWVVYGHHDDVLSYVAPGEVERPDGEGAELRVGLIGRSKRDLDGHELSVVHVEDRRARPGQANSPG